MIHVRFLEADGRVAAEANAAPGMRLLALAQQLGLPLEGTCEGAMACSTCHVIVAASDFPKLGPLSVHEEDMLDFTPHVTPTSRLACQVVLDETVGVLEVRLPPAHADMRGI
jgi:ferredoxin